MHNFVLSNIPSVFLFELVASDNVKYRINMEKNRRGLSVSILVHTFITSESILVLVDSFFCLVLLSIHILIKGCY